MLLTENVDVRPCHGRVRSNGTAETILGHIVRAQVGPLHAKTGGKPLRGPSVPPPVSNRLHEKDQNWPYVAPCTFVAMDP